MVLVLILVVLAAFFLFFAILVALRDRFFNPRKAYLKKWIDPDSASGERPGSSTSVERKEFEGEPEAIQKILRKNKKYGQFYYVVRTIHPKMTVARFFLICCLIFFFTVFFLTQLSNVPLLYALPIALVFGFFVPRLYARFVYQKRLTRFNELLPDGLRIMIGGLRAGYGISGAFEMVAQDGPKPLNEEFQIVLEEMELGLSVDISLKNLVERVKTRDTEFFTTSVVLQKETGGNLADLMSGLEETIRERQRIVREAKTLLAQSKVSALFLTLVPIGVACFVIFFNEQFKEILLSHPMGKMLLLAAICFEVMGVLLVRRLMKIPLY